ncbi:MAG: motility protein A [Planctomycetota bacterium]|jgi:chemotaxis protein MotA
MDIATPGGMLIGLVLLIVAIMIGGGASGIGAFINIPSMMIVIGGTIAATLVRYPLGRVFGLMGIVMKTVFFKLSTPQIEVQRMVQYAKVARKEGLLALENKLADVKDTFLAKAIQLLVDGTDADNLRTILDREIDNLRQRHTIGKGILESMGTVAPAFGMMGTLIGLVLMLRELDDPSKIGIGMATALITTFYGVLLANLVCLPMGGKLELRSKEEILLKELMVEGIVAIQSGDNPNIVEEKLKIYLSPSQRKSKESKDSN